MYTWSGNCFCWSEMLMKFMVSLITYPKNKKGQFQLANLILTPLAYQHPDDITSRILNINRLMITGWVLWNQRILIHWKRSEYLNIIWFVDFKCRIRRAYGICADKPAFIVHIIPLAKISSTNFLERFSLFQRYFNLRASESVNRMAWLW
jgi:hypothetical protein